MKNDYENLGNDYKRFLEPTKRELTKKEEAERIKRAYSDYRHYKNERSWKRVTFPFTFPFKILKFIRRDKLVLNLLAEIEVLKGTIKSNEREMQRLKRVIESKDRYRQAGILHWHDKYLEEDGMFIIGKDSRDNLVVVDFNIYSNLLIGGSPGSGKTGLMKLLTYQALKYESVVYVGDFKKGVDFTIFDNKCNVIIDHQELLKILKVLNREIDRRAKLFKDTGTDNLHEYNKYVEDNNRLTRQYLIIDELGEAMSVNNLTMDKKTKKELENDLEAQLKSIARLGRAFGINLICGTQRPDVGILEGQIRSQFLGRICFLADKATSLMVLDEKGAEQLPTTPGRAIVKIRTSCLETQVFKFNKELIKNIPNKRANLRVINENTRSNKNDSIVDYEID